MESRTGSGRWGRILLTTWLLCTAIYTSPSDCISIRRIPEHPFLVLYNTIVQQKILIEGDQTNLTIRCKYGDRLCSDVADTTSNSTYMVIDFIFNEQNMINDTDVVLVVWHQGRLDEVITTETFTTVLPRKDDGFVQCTASTREGSGETATAVANTPGDITITLVPDHRYLVLYNRFVQQKVIIEGDRTNFTIDCDYGWRKCSDVANTTSNATHMVTVFGFDKLGNVVHNYDVSLVISHQDVDRLGEVIAMERFTTLIPERELSSEGFLQCTSSTVATTQEREVTTTIENIAHDDSAGSCVLAVLLAVVSSVLTRY